MSEPKPAPDKRFRTFVAFWATQSVPAFGTALTYFSISIWLTQVLYPLPEQKAALAGALSAVSLATALPIILAAPLAGAWTDRHDRKTTMFTANVLSAGLCAALSLVLGARVLNLWPVIAIVALTSGIGAFHSSAFDASYVMVVPRELLPRANGMVQTTWALAGVLSPAVAAAVIALPSLARGRPHGNAIWGLLGRLSDGTPIAVALNGIAFLAASAALPFLRIPSPRRLDLEDVPGGNKRSMWSDIREGAVYIFRRPSLLWLLGSFAVVNLAVSPMGVLSPLLLKFKLAPSWESRGLTFAAAMALMGTAGSLGGITGGLAVSLWGGLRQKRVYGVILPMIGAGCAEAALGISPSFFAVLALAFLLYAMTPVMNAHSQSIWQAQTPVELQGRVFAVRRLIAQFTWPISSALAGTMSARFSPSAVVSVMGVTAAVFSVAQLWNKRLLRVEDIGVA